MTNNGGFQSFYPPNGGYNTRTFHRSNTYMPPNPYQNTGYIPQQPLAPPQPLQHTNTYMPQPPMYAPPSQPIPPPNSYVPPPTQQVPPPNPYVPPPTQQVPPPNPYVPPPTQQVPPPNSYIPPPYQQAPTNNAYIPPPQAPSPQIPPPMPPQQNYLHHSNTYISPSPSPYQNPPQQPYAPPTSLAQAPYMAPLPKIQRANTYYPPQRPPTIYDNINAIPQRLAPQRTMATPSRFNPEEDCKILRKAVHGFGTDERAIINIVVNRNMAQRQEIRKAYKACFGKDLIKRLQEDTSGNFKQVISAMFMTPAEYDAYCLYKAMKGLGTDEGVLIEIIGTRNNQQLQEIKDIFEKEYKNSLENWIKGDTSGNFKLLLIALLQCNRSTNPNPDFNVCQADAQALFKAGEGRWGTDESTFIRIFANRSAAEMACINQCYTQLRGKSLLKAIDKEFSGDIKKLLLTVVGGLLDAPGYFATRIREAVRGLGTNDTKLVRVIVSRCEIDLPYIKQAYQRIYHRDLLYDVRSDTSGYYRDILTGLISRC